MEMRPPVSTLGPLVPGSGPRGGRSSGLLKGAHISILGTVKTELCNSSPPLRLRPQSPWSWVELLSTDAKSSSAICKAPLEGPKKGMEGPSRG